jgi:DNA (cytosine-5)-methyltransferase 1
MGYPDARAGGGGMTDDQLTVLDLFSGIGGFSLGLERTGGFRTIAFCETDPFCRAVLAHHWPGIPIHDDVRTLTAGVVDGYTRNREIEANAAGLGIQGCAESTRRTGTDEFSVIEVICGGFPCQPWSHAGKRRGHEDDRDLWPEMRRIIAECRPRWVLGENVSGFVSQPMGFDRCLADLEAEGYAVGAVMVPACAVGAPHRRDRIWIVAHAQDVRGADVERREPDGVGELLDGGVAADADKGIGWRGGSQDRQAWIGPVGGGEISADAIGQGLEIVERQRRDDGPQRATPERDGDAGPRRLVEPGLRRVDDGVSRWLDGRTVPPPVARGVPNRVQRLRALGNSVVPQVVEAIGRAILEAERDMTVAA